MRPPAHKGIRLRPAGKSARKTLDCGFEKQKKFCGLGIEKAQFKNYLLTSDLCPLTSVFWLPTFQTEFNEILYFFIFLYNSVRWIPSILAALALLLLVSCKVKRMASFSVRVCTSLNGDW